MATSSQEQIAKDILLAVLDKGIVLLPARGTYANDDEIAQYNEKRAKQIAAFYKIILEAVEEGTGGKGGYPRPITVI